MVKPVFASPFEKWKIPNRSCLSSCVRKGFLPSTNGSTSSLSTTKNRKVTPLCYPPEPYVQCVRHHSVYPMGGIPDHVPFTSFLHVLTIRSPSLLAGAVPFLNAANRTPNQHRTSKLPLACSGTYHLLLPTLFLPRIPNQPRRAMLFA